MDIKGLAEQICKKYNSRDPFEIELPQIMQTVQKRALVGNIEF